MWQKCIKRARLAQGIMTYVTTQFRNSSLHINGQRRRVLNYCQGARGEKQVWRPYVRTWDLSEANVHCTEVLVTLLELFGARQSFRSLIVIRRPGNCAPCPPSLRPWLLHAVTRLNKSCCTIHSSNQRHIGTLGFRRGKIFNAPEFLRHFEEKRTGEFCRAMVLFQKLA